MNVYTYVPVQLQVLDFEINPNGGNEGRGEGVVGISQQQTGLAHTWLIIVIAKGRGLNQVELSYSLNLRTSLLCIYVSMSKCTQRTTITNH